MLRGVLGAEHRGDVPVLSRDAFSERCSYDSRIARDHSPTQAGPRIVRENAVDEVQ